MNPKHSITICLEEVKYDVKFDSWKKEKVFNVNAEQANRTHLSYDSDKANDWLCRQIQDAVDNIYGELAWCTREDEGHVSDVIDEAPTDWKIDLYFSPQWAGSMRALRSATHDYIANYVLSRWYRATNTQGLENYERDAELAINRLYNEARSERVEFTPWKL